MLNYDQFLNENEKQNFLKQAGDILDQDAEMAEILNDCEEGKYTAVQILPTPGTKRYVAVAINDGYPVADIYQTSDPKRALLALLIKNLRISSREAIIGELTSNSQVLQYSVFASDKKPTLKEIADRFNFNYADFSGDALAFYTSTPISKRY
jgi:hypothetical protein